MMIISNNRIPRLVLPIYTAQVSAGSFSPDQHYIVDILNLNKYLVKHPAATFLMRVTEKSMVHSGIHESDILVVDRNMTAIPGKIVIAAINGELTIKRLHKQKNGKFSLVTDNPDYAPIQIVENIETCIWGVVTYVIHTV